METLRLISRIGLGALLLISGIYLFLYHSPDKLAGIFEDFNRIFPPIPGYLKPFAREYFLVNTVLFAVSGIFAIVGVAYAPYIQLTASTMFCLTYDNPFIARPDEKQTRYVFLLCHAMIFAALQVLFENTNSESSKKKEKEDSDKSEVKAEPKEKAKEQPKDGEQDKDSKDKKPKKEKVK